MSSASEWRLLLRVSELPGVNYVGGPPTQLSPYIRRPAPVQGSRHRERERRVWPARDRLQPDPPGQPAQTGDGGGMNRWLPRGVPMRRPPGSPNGAKRLKSGVLSR